jgi:hypothetical protein
MVSFHFKLTNLYLYAAESFPDRTSVQCLHRWQKVLNPELIKGPWTQEVCPIHNLVPQNEFLQCIVIFQLLSFIGR